MGDTQARCLHCRKRFAPGHRPNLKYCKPGCRTLAYRARRRAAEPSDDPEAGKKRGRSKPAHRETAKPLQPPIGLPDAQQSSGEAPSEIIAVVSALKHQHEQSSVTLEQLLSLVNSARQREQDLERELRQAQEALNARGSDQQRLETELTNLREQLAKREQAEASEEDTRRRLQNVERFIEALTREQQQRREADHALLDGQIGANKLLKSELTASQGQLNELAATVKQLRDENAELSQRLAAGQNDLSAAQRRITEQEAELEQVRQEHAKGSELARQTLSESTAQRLALEAEVTRLHQEQVTTRRQLTDASTRLGELASIRAAETRTHTEQIARLTAEKDDIVAQHRALQASVRDLVPLPFSMTDQLWVRGTPLQTRLKNPLVCFLEPLFARKAEREKFDDNLMRLGVLLVQCRINAMMALGAGSFTPAASEALLQHVLTSLLRYKDFYPDEARALAAQKEGPLRALERVISAEVAQQLRRALAAAPVT